MADPLLFSGIAGVILLIVVLSMFKIRFTPNKGKSKRTFHTMSVLFLLIYFVVSFFDREPVTAFFVLGIAFFAAGMSSEIIQNPGKKWMYSALIVLVIILGALLFLLGGI